MFSSKFKVTGNAHTQRLYPRETAIGVRRDMRERLWLTTGQIDWFTGAAMPDHGSKPCQIGPVTYLSLDILILMVATLVAAIAATHLPLWAAVVVVPIAWLVQTGRLRKMQTLEGHESAHGNFFLNGDSRRTAEMRIFGLSLNDFFGELATTVALSLNVQDYRISHDLHHDAATYTTLEDPDTAEVLRLRRPLQSLLDPRAYIRDFGRRLRSNLLTARPARQAMTVVMLALLVAPLAVLPVQAWIAAIVVPWGILFRVSGILQILSLHDWLLPPSVDAQDYASRTWARHSGVPLPQRGLRGIAWLIAWGAWWSEMLLIELPFRIGVLSPDLQAHDVHHLEWIMVHDLKILPQFVDDWRNQPYRRAEVIRDSGDFLAMAEREHWGVRSFVSLSRANLRRLRGEG